MDLHAVLSSTCSAIPGALGIAGAVMQLAEPVDDRRFFASDAWAAWIGEVQYREGMGPLLTALRTGRVLMIDDLTRIGPPTVAATAAEYGLVSSLALPIEADGVRAGALQLLGEVHRPVEAAHADVLRPLLEVLAARLLDVQDLRRAASRATPVAARDPAADPASDRASDGAVPPRVSASGVADPASPAHAEPTRVSGTGQTRAPSPRRRSAESGAFDASAWQGRSLRAAGAPREVPDNRETDTRAMPVLPTQRRHQHPSNPIGPADSPSGDVGRR